MDTGNCVSRVLQRFSETRLLVVGDFLLDEFIFGDISRVSREAPVLILDYSGRRRVPGGGGNTVANAASLGAQVRAVGCVGKDEAGSELLDLWPGNVERERVLQDPEIRTTLKSRILAGSFHSFRQQVVRLDYENPFPFEAERERRLCRTALDGMQDCQGVIISDYSLGNITPGLAQAVISEARELGIPVIVDSRDHPGSFRRATSITPNITEVEKALGRPHTNELEKVEDLGRSAREQWDLDALLITRGRLGMSLFTPQEPLHIPPFGSESPVDVTGASDTVAATYATALAVGASFEEAAQLANRAGGLVVMKKGTATVTIQELKNALGEDG